MYWHMGFPGGSNWYSQVQEKHPQAEYRKQILKPNYNFHMFINFASFFGKTNLSFQIKLLHATNTIDGLDCFSLS